MDFGWTEDQAAVRDLVRKVARDEIAPGYLERAQASAFPWDVHRQLGRLGVLGLLAGPGYSQLDQADFVAVGRRWRNWPTPTSTWPTPSSRCC